MNLLPFGKLPAYKPRKFVPPTIDLGNWLQIAPLFEQLEKHAPDCKTTADLEHWLLDWSELNAALDEESSRRYIAMTCHTDSAEAEKAYLHFVERVEPQLKPRQFALEKIYAAHPLRGKLSSDRFRVFDRDINNHVELFRPENVALETG
jgi:oligoendopeptidase F